MKIRLQMRFFAAAPPTCSRVTGYWRFQETFRIHPILTGTRPVVTEDKGQGRAGLVPRSPFFPARDAQAAKPAPFFLPNRKYLWENKIIYISMLDSEHCLLNGYVFILK